MDTYKEEQRRIARIALHATHGRDFALAGSGAIREHGLITRPTEDIDLFTINNNASLFNAAVERAIDALRQNGYDVSEKIRSQGFCRIRVTSQSHSYTTEIDFGIDWRAHPPVKLEIGDVLSEVDAITNKLFALYSRGETRDFLDCDSIRESHRYSDRQLLTFLQDSMPSFDAEFFIMQLTSVTDIHPYHVQKYGVSEHELENLKSRLLTFADFIRHNMIENT